MKKTLVYYFYCTRETFKNEVNRVHFECLRNYNNIFNEIKFCISINDTNDIVLIKKIQKEVLDIFDVNYSKISFYIYHNNIELCECGFFYNEIIDKLSEHELVFFGHNKGFLSAKEKEKINLYYWIIGAYYYSLEFIEEVELCLSKQGHNGLFYGSFLLNDYKIDFDLPYSIIESKYPYQYSGTYYWINCEKLKKHIEKNGIKILKPYSRYYAENFPGEITDMSLMFSHNNRYLNIDTMNDMYSKVRDNIEYLYPEDIIFERFFNNILKKVSSENE